MSLGQFAYANNTVSFLAAPPLQDGHALPLRACPSTVP